MHLYGRSWTRRELEAHVGRLEQVAGVRRARWIEGPEAAVEHIQVRTGAGLAYTVVPDRGLDISTVEFAGVPISWQSPNGETHPAYYDARDQEWLHTAAGGLLMTCGLTQVGSPSTDAGEQLGQHGRIHHLPARQVAATGSWDGDEYEMRVSGTVEETAIFGHQLRLFREIRSRLGENRLSITDVVENAGFRPAPHMLLYHFNFGFPLLSPETEIQWPSRRVVPRESTTPLEGYDRWQTPALDHPERVYYHEDLVTRDGWAVAALRNPRFPVANGAGAGTLTMRLSWTTANLPRLVQWKMPGSGEHVLGIEPANCHVEGRAAERARGTLAVLEPGETRTYQLALNLEWSER
jgi:hypothetical protein